MKISLGMSLIRRDCAISATWGVDHLSRATTGGIKDYAGTLKMEVAVPTIFTRGSSVDMVLLMLSALFVIT
jgi:hypothetical protein